MATKDIQSILKPKEATGNQVFITDGFLDGFAIDTQDFNGLVFSISCTAHTAGVTFTNVLLESDDNVTYSITDAKFVRGTAVTDAVTSETVDPKTLGYVGKKRYVKLRTIAAGISSGNGGTVTGQAVLGEPKEAPVV